MIRMCNAAPGITPVMRASNTSIHKGIIHKLQKQTNKKDRTLFRVSKQDLADDLAIFDSIPSVPEHDPSLASDSKPKAEFMPQSQEERLVAANFAKLLEGNSK